MNHRDDLGGERMFRLSALRGIHAGEHHDFELMDVLGDGALLNRIGPLAHARRTLVMRGYSFMPAAQITGSHSLFPMLELTEILRTRTIPYYRTAIATEHVLDSDPDLALTDTLFRDSCVASHTFHEGAHAIFYDVARDLQGEPRGRQRVEVLLVSEAFAMAFEQLASLLAFQDGRRSTALFLALNAYTSPLDFPTSNIETTKRVAGLASASPARSLAVLVAAHLIALVRPNAAKALPGLGRRLASQVGLDADGDDADALVSLGFKVDQDFRHRTQRNFYEHLGLQAELCSILEAPLESHFATGSAVDRFLWPATQCVLGPQAILL